jgi:hypothetical protein
MMAIFARDYAGYRDKVAGREAALRALTDSVRAVARTADTYQVCIPALQRFTRFFWDPHVTGPWQGSPPSPASATPTAAGPAQPSDDPQRPALTFVDESTAVVRLADLDVSYKARLDSLVTAAWPRLLAAPYLVVDLRGNGGGCTCVTDTLRPLLYTGPIQITGQDILASPDNTAWLRDWYEKNTAQFSAADRADHAALISNMATHPGAMVPFGRDTVITRDSVLVRPLRVAVLVDSACASSCEDFVLEARQSRKVLVLGSGHTKGVFDYGNARTVVLPGWRRVRFGTSRQRGEHYDHVGIEPDIRIPANVRDTIAYALAAARRFSPQKESRGASLRRRFVGPAAPLRHSTGPPGVSRDTRADHHRPGCPARAALECRRTRP